MYKHIPLKNITKIYGNKRIFNLSDRHLPYELIIESTSKNKQEIHSFGFLNKTQVENEILYILHKYKDYT